MKASLIDYCVFMLFVVNTWWFYHFPFVFECFEEIWVVFWVFLGVSCYFECLKVIWRLLWSILVFSCYLRSICGVFSTSNSFLNVLERFELFLWCCFCFSCVFECLKVIWRLLWQILAFSCYLSSIYGVFTTSHLFLRALRGFELFVYCF